jgi:hypothetical protein
MNYHSLAEAVAAHPFPEYTNWWPVKPLFSGGMAEAIGSTWRELPGNSGELAPVRAYVDEYMATVYHRPLTPGLVEAFAAGAADPLKSGEFDALSYGFFRAAFELSQDRRGFAQTVGRRFFRKVEAVLDLALPAGLRNAAEFAQLQRALQRLGRFLLEQGYLRTHFAFRFDVARGAGGQLIHQTADQVVERLQHGQTAYALYEMGYPVILPSATYLFNTLGEAQHHSSRIIEELFSRLGCNARETDEFDPTNFGADLVVELWKIQPCA